MRARLSGYDPVTDKSPLMETFPEKVTTPDESIVSLALPPVDSPIWSGPPENNPVLVSPVKLNVGEPAEPANNDALLPSLLNKEKPPGVDPSCMTHVLRVVLTVTSPTAPVKVPVSPVVPLRNCTWVDIRLS